MLYLRSPRPVGLLLLLTLALMSLAAGPTASAQDGADQPTRDRVWWGFEGNEYWNLHWPRDRGPNPGSIEELDGARLITIEPRDEQISLQVYGGSRREDRRVLTHAQQLTLDAHLLEGDPVDLVLTLRDADGEKFRFQPVRVEPGEQTVTWRIPQDVEEAYHGEPSDGEMTWPVHLFNFKLQRAATDQPTRLRLVEGVVSERIAATEGLSVRLGSPHAPAALMLDGREDESPVVIENQTDRPREAEVRIELLPRDGEQGQAMVHEATVTVPAEGEATVPLPWHPGRFGIHRLHHTLTVGEDQMADTLRFGYMDPAGNEAGQNDGFEMNLAGLHDTTDYDLAALVGAEAARIGINWRSIQPAEDRWRWDAADAEVREMSARGIRPQWMVAYTAPWATAEPYASRMDRDWHLRSSPPRLDAWANFIETLATRYDGQVRYWEIWNEPDLEHFYKGTTEDYLAMLRTAHEVLKRVNPENQVLTGGFATVLPHGGHSLNPDIHHRTVAEAQDSFDVHAHHQHGRFSGFARAIDNELSQIRETLDSDRPLYFTETGVNVEQSGGHPEQAQELVKKMSFAFARGAVGYSWFVLRGSRPGHVGGYGIMDADRTPRDGYLAYNELTRQLADTRFVEQHEPDTGRYILQFAEPDAGRHVMVLWHEDDQAPAAPLLVRLPEGATAQRVDIYGNAEPLEAVGGLLTVAVEPEPAFLRITEAGDGPAVLEPLVRADTTLVTVGADGSGIVPLMLHNPTDEPRELRMTLRVDDGQPREAAVQMTADASRSQAQPFELPDGQASGTLHVQVTLSGADGQDPLSQTVRVPVVRTLTLPTEPMDGRDPDFVLDARDDVVNYFQADPGNEHLTWQGEADLSARLWLEATDAGLAIRVVATDDEHRQDQPAGRLWQADSLQLGVAGGEQTGFWELGVALRDGQTMTHIFGRPGGRQGSPELQATAHRSGNQTTYELTVPWVALGGDPETVRLSFVVNDRDADRREGLVRLTPGIDAGKDATQFLLLRR